MDKKSPPAEDAGAGPKVEQTPSLDLLRSSLMAIRDHMGLDIAYMSQFVDGRVVFHEVVAPDMDRMVAEGLIVDKLRPGNSMVAEETYCHHVMEGLLPQMIPDTKAIEIARNLAVTDDLKIGAHVGIPIKLKDGTKYGMFCGLNHAANPLLTDRDMRTMQMFADLVTHHLDAQLSAHTLAGQMHDEIGSVVKHNDFDLAYQPILNIQEMQTVGYEALCRFRGSDRTPDQWFAEAENVGRLVELELSVIEQALAPLSGLYPLKFLSVNASPQTAVSESFMNLMMRQPLDRIVLEITEHAEVDSYDHLLTALRPLRRRGMRLAVDDAGAGYSSLRHILRLRPDIIKLDMSITRDLDRHSSRRALVRALVHFSHETHGHVVAEGIETPTELETLRSLGVQKGQGYLLGAPEIGLFSGNKAPFPLRA